MIIQKSNVYLFSRKFNPPFIYIMADIEARIKCQGTMTRATQERRCYRTILLIARAGFEHSLESDGDKRPVTKRKSHAKDTRPYTNQY